MGRSRLATRRPYLAAQVREQLCVRLSKPPRRKVSDDRVRFLNQFEPLPAEIEYLKPLQTEEARLRAIIEHDCPEHMEELGYRPEYRNETQRAYLRIDWSCVDLARKDLFIPRSKNGESRHVSLNRGPVLLSSGFVRRELATGRSRSSPKVRFS
jgi:hypothetical protein